MSPSYQTRSVANFAQTVMQPAHNADFCQLRISKIPANAHETNCFSALDIGCGSIVLRENCNKNFELTCNNIFATLNLHI